MEARHADFVGRVEERLKDIEAAVHDPEETSSELQRKNLEERIPRMVKSLILEMMPADASGGKAIDARTERDQSPEKEEILDKITLLESNLATVVENSAKNFQMLRRRFNEILLELRPKKDVRLISQRSTKADARK
jgi:hypothetical protein